MKTHKQGALSVKSLFCSVGMKQAYTNLQAGRSAGNATVAGGAATKQGRSAGRRAQQMPLCAYGAACTRKGCVYRHPPKPVGSGEVCKPFLAGLCQYGRKCNNVHPDAAEAARLRAKYAAIQCRFGLQCKSMGCLFAHPAPEQQEPYEQGPVSYEQYELNYDDELEALCMPANDQGVCMPVNDQGVYMPVNDQLDPRWEENLPQFPSGLLPEEPWLGDRLGRLELSSSMRMGGGSDLSAAASEWRPNAAATEWLPSAVAGAQPPNMLPQSGEWYPTAPGLGPAVASEWYPNTGAGEWYPNGGAWAQQPACSPSKAVGTSAGSGTWAAIAATAPTDTGTSAALGVKVVERSHNAERQPVRIPTQLWLVDVSRIEAADAFAISDPCSRFVAVNEPHTKRSADAVVPLTLSHAPEAARGGGGRELVGVMDLHYQSVRTASIVLDTLLPAALERCCAARFEPDLSQRGLVNSRTCMHPYTHANTRPNPNQVRGGLADHRHWASH